MSIKRNVNEVQCRCKHSISLDQKVNNNPFFSQENQDRLIRAVNDAKNGINMHYHDLVEE